MVFLKEFFEKVDFEKTQQTTKHQENFPGSNELKQRILIDWPIPSKRNFKDMIFPVTIIWASSVVNLATGFLTKQGSNRSAQLKRLARILKF